MANILSRFKSIMAANINDIIDKWEDPAKMVTQTLRELRESLAEAKQETAGVMAIEKQRERELNEVKESLEKVTVSAENAVKAGNDDDALKLLERQAELEQKLNNAQNNYDIAKKNSDNMRAMIDKLGKDIKTLEDKEQNIKATVANAKAQQTVNKAMGKVDSDKGIAAFNRMEEKANKMLDQAQAMSQLDSEAGNETENLVDKYAQPSATAQARLAELKRKNGMA